MFVNHDFSLRASVTPENYRWVNSPQAGVVRVMLDRVGGEIARATSLVRYAPESHFPHHIHPGGEEILVLEGTFSEGEQHYPAGWYLRNPPGSSHQPASRDGALILVKLGQMDSSDQKAIRINTQDVQLWRERDGVMVCPLFEDQHEKVCLQRLPSSQTLFHQPLTGGAEIFILEGSVAEAGQLYSGGSWLRFPPGAFPPLITAEPNTVLYLKTDHLLSELS